MAQIVVTKPPENLAFGSLAELYEQFHSLLVGKDFRCPRGIPVMITTHHFFHLVKLQKNSETRFIVEVEEPLIKATKEGFGEYSIDQSRAERLSWVPEILTEPHEVWEFDEKKTADEIFLREYDKSGSRFRAALLKRDGSHLRLITCMPVRARKAERLRQTGTKLWP